MQTNDGVPAPQRFDTQDEAFAYNQKRMGINVFDSGPISSLKEI